MSWLSIDSGVQSAIFILGDQHVKKRYGAIFSRFFTCEMDVIINGIDVFQEGIFLCFLDDGEGIIYKPFPWCRGDCAVKVLKGGHTIKDLLMAPKDKDPILKKSGVIYRYKCDRLDCDEEYIGESARNLEERFKEHLKTPSPIHDHLNISGDAVTIENFSILGERQPKPHEDHKGGPIYYGQ